MDGWDERFISRHSCWIASLMGFLGEAFLELLSVWMEFANGGSRSRGGSREREGSLIYIYTFALAVERISGWVALWSV